MHTYRIVLADDDPIILKSILTMVDWKRLDCKIVGTAGSGEEALEMVRRFHPQILITDIRMRGMNGLDAIEACAALYPDIRFIVISSYDDFQYAMRAIQNNVADYILKNELTTARLLQSLEKLIASLSARTAYSYMLHMNDFQQYFSGSMDVPFPDSLKEFQNRTFIFTVISKSRQFERLSEVTDHDDVLCLNELLWQTLNEFSGFPILFELGNLTIAALGADLLRTSPRDSVRNFMHALTLRLGNTALPYLFFTEQKSVTPKAFKKMLIPLLPIIRFYRYFPGSCTTFSFSSLKECKFEPITNSFPYHKMILDEEHEERNILLIREYLGRCMDSFCISSVLSFYSSFCIHLEISSNNQLTFPNALYAPHPEAFLKWTFNSLSDCTKLLTRGLKYSYSPIVESAIQYMKQNYSNSDLASADIASSVGLSANRLGVLFKKETGKTVNEYLAVVRVEKAIELLEKTNLKIYEISERCGYKSSQYFSQIVLQHTGKRPLDFRKINRNDM